MKKVFTLFTVLLVSFGAFSQTKTTTNTKPVVLKGTTTKKQVTKTTAKNTALPTTKIINVDDKKAGGHDITLTLNPAKNQKAYLACYYGKGKAIMDSCMLDDKCVGHFKGKDKLTGGIYFIVSQAYSIQFEVLIGEVQNFSIIGDTTHKDKFNIVGSPDNDLFKSYSTKSAELGTALNKITEKYKEAKTKEDTTLIYKEYKAQNEKLNKYRDDVVEKNPNTLMAALLTAMKRPESPEIPIDAVTKKADSTYPYRFVKEHYFDDVSFSDERLLRTPFFEGKIDEYLKYYVSSESDSIIPEIKYFLLSARESKEMYAYLLTKFTNKYINPEFMGQDKVFVHLFTDYYLHGDTTYLDIKSKKTIIDRGYSMMLGLIGNTAPPLDLIDTTGKVISLYSLKNKFTVVAYWDPTCGHCRQELPTLDSIYKAKWKAEDVKIYSIISKDDLIPELKKFIKEKDLSNDWYYTYETKAAKEATEKAGIPNFRQAYDFNKTPIFYILDADKKIIGKQLTIHQIDDLITRKIKSGK